MSGEKPNTIKKELLKLKATIVAYFRTPLTVISKKAEGDDTMYLPRGFFLRMVALFLGTRKIVNYIHDKIPGQAPAFNKESCLTDTHDRLLKAGMQDAHERTIWSNLICTIRDWVDADDLRINASIIFLFVVTGILLLLFTLLLFGRTIKAGALANNILCSYAIGLCGIVLYTIVVGAVQIFYPYKEYSTPDMVIFFLLLSGLPLFFHLRTIVMKRGKLSFVKGSLTVSFYLAANFFGCIFCMLLLMDFAPFIDKWLKW